MRSGAHRLPVKGRRCRRRLLLPLALIGWLALPGLGYSGETGEEFWPEFDLTCQHDSHLPVSSRLALTAILNVYL